jgi:solute carrier family 25 S-adenosylmethionine transporter 26
MDMPWHEGAARFCSQLLTYAMEADKTFLQVHGRMPRRMSPGALMSCVCQSAFTSGIVYQVYFAVHRGMTAAGAGVAAGVGAAFATSVIKIPISNSMRVMQATETSCVVSAGRRILATSGPRALYSGYLWSIAEDIVEMDVRLRLYDAIAAAGGPGLAGVAPVATGFAFGAASGGLAAALTTPFDNVRSILAYHAAHRAAGAPDLATWWRANGAGGLYRGARLRAVGTGLKTAYFYAFLEGIRAMSRPHA